MCMLGYDVGMPLLWLDFPLLESNTHLTILLSQERFRLCLVPEKFEEKCEGKKIQRKSRRKEKVKENKKIE